MGKAVVAVFGGVTVGAKMLAAMFVLTIVMSDCIAGENGASVDTSVKNTALPEVSFAARKCRIGSLPKCGDSVALASVHSALAPIAGGRLSVGVTGCSGRVRGIC